MDESLHYYWFQAKKIEHANQNKVNASYFILVFFLFYCFESLYSKMLPSDSKCELHRFVKKVVMFQEALQFQEAIAIYYNK
jgi:hypothetical protein